MLLPVVQQDLELSVENEQASVGMNLGRRNAPFRPSGPRHLPPRTFLAAVGLFTIGSVLLSQGVPLWKGAAHGSADEERGLAMIILGSIGTL